MKKAISIISVILVIALLVFAGYKGYQRYQEWKESQKTTELKLVEALKENQGIIIKLKTEIAEIEKRVVTETLKEKTVIKEESPTYKSKKEELIELRKEPEANKEKIEVARVAFEERINEFQGSPDKILINTGEEKIVIYEDKKGNMVSLESGVTITRHRDVEEVIKELQTGAVIEKEADKYKLAFGVVYDLEDKGYYPGISYQLADWKNLSLNITGYDFDNIKGGLDICYNVSDNILVGVGMNLLEIEDFKFNLDKYYLKIGVEFNF